VNHIGAGYTTTESQKKINDEKDRRNEELFAKAMASITILAPKKN
jgi:hypothetical protein